MRRSALEQSCVQRARIEERVNAFLVDGYREAWGWHEENGERQSPGPRERPSLFQDVGAARYSSSVTCPPHVALLPSSSTWSIARCVMKRSGNGAVPVILAGLEEHAVAGTDHFDRAAAVLREADAFDHVDRLPVRMGVPGGTCARREVDAAQA